MRVLLLRAGADLLAVPMAVAREVVIAPRLTSVPATGRNVAGLFNLRGDIVPVFDTAMLLGLGTISSVAFVAVVETGSGLAGLAMTDMGESVELGEPIAETDTPGTLGSYALGTDVVVMIDVTTLLAPDHIVA